MDSFGFKILLALACLCAASGQEEPEQVLIQESSPQEVAVGDTTHFTCTVNRGLEFIISNKILWVHVSSVTNTEVQLSEQGTLKDAASPSDYEVVLDHQSAPGSIILKLTLKSVKAEQDGKFICRVTGKLSLEQEIELVVINNVESVELTFDGEGPVTSVEPNAAQRVEGAYDFSCKASGFNPTATIALFLGQQKLNPMFSSPTPDAAASTAAGARRFTMEASVKGYALNSAADGKAIRCVAKATFTSKSAVPRTASLPLQIITLEPTIICDKNISHSVGDLYVKISCTVDHSNVKVDRYEYEIGETGQRIPVGNQTEDYDEVRVQELNNTATVVTLELYELKVKHVDPTGGATYFYLDVYTKDGKQFREKAALYLRPTSAASTQAAFVLTILISLILSL